MIAAALLAVQAAAFLLFLHRAEARHTEERRFLVNQAIAKTPQDFAIMQAAARPDGTVEAIAEARVPRPSTPAPLGL